MKDFREQARKHGIDLLTEGICQFCGSHVARGVFECMEIFANGILSFDYGLPEVHQTRFLIVDAHALQHPELHGRWNNHFHLMRLNLILERNAQWDYRKSPRLSEFLHEYKMMHPEEVLVAPPKLERGNMTAKDVSHAATAREREALVSDWARQVYDAWKPYHRLVSDVTGRFLSELSGNPRPRVQADC
jgi:hypothetical protein